MDVTVLAFTSKLLNVEEAETWIVYLVAPDTSAQSKIGLSL